MLGALFTILPQEIFTLLLLGAQKVIYSVADYNLSDVMTGNVNNRSINQSIHLDFILVYKQ